MFGEGGQRRAVRRRGQRPAERRRRRRRAGRRGRRRPDRRAAPATTSSTSSPARSSPIPPSPCATSCSTSSARAWPAATCIRLSGGEFAWVGQINVNPSIGAALARRRRRLTQLGYIQRNGNTFLVADTNDDGRLDGDDFTVEFRGLHNFTPDDFDNTDFIIAGTNGDDVITGTEGDDRIFAAGGNDQVFALGGDDEVHGGTGDDFLDGGPGGFDNLFGEEGNDELTLATSDGGGVASGGDGRRCPVRQRHVVQQLRQQPAGRCRQRRPARRRGRLIHEWRRRVRTGCSAARPTTRWTPDATSSVRSRQRAGSVRLHRNRALERGGSFFGDTISGFQDGSDLFDLRGSGLQFSDLTIVNEEFQTTITSSRGTITIFENFDAPVVIDRG